MREIKFTTKYEQPLSFLDEDFKQKYEERINKKPNYTKRVSGELKHLAVCPKCNNPVVIRGIYKKIDGTPHARHAKGIDIDGVTQYNEYRYLLYSYRGIPLYHMLIRKESVLYKKLRSLGNFSFRDSRIKGYVYVANNNEHTIVATDYTYSVGKNDELREWLHMSVTRPDENLRPTCEAVLRFKLEVDSSYFWNLVNYKGWKTNQKMLDIAKEYMGS